MRNYKNEAKWAKEKYERIDARIDKQIGQELKRVLKQNETSMAKWITESALVYLDVKDKEKTKNLIKILKNT